MAVTFAQKLLPGQLYYLLNCEERSIRRMEVRVAPDRDNILNAKSHSFLSGFFVVLIIVAATYFTRFDPSIIGGSGLGAPGLTSLFGMGRGEQYKKASHFCKAFNY